MLKKLSIVLSIVAVFGLGLALTVPQSVLAKDHKQQGNKQHKSMQKNVVVHKNVHVKKTYVVGKKYKGHVWYGHHRHRWHGKWYEYGVGECWIEIDGDWFWNDLVCP
jgi:hypothetical protein